MGLARVDEKDDISLLRVMTKDDMFKKNSFMTGELLHVKKYTDYLGRCYEQKLSHDHVRFYIYFKRG